MSDEITVQNKNSILPMSIGRIHKTSTDASTKSLSKAKDYINESYEYTSFEKIINETGNNDCFEKFLNNTNIDETKKIKIKEKIKIVNETNSKIIHEAKKTIREIVKNAINKANANAPLEESEKARLGMYNFLKKHVNSTDNLKNDIKIFIKGYKKLEEKTSLNNFLEQFDFIDEYLQYILQVEKPNLKTLDINSENYLKKLRAANKLKKDLNFVEKCNEFKTAKMKIKIIKSHIKSIL